MSPIGAIIASYVGETDLIQSLGEEERPFDFTFSVPFYEKLAQRPVLKGDDGHTISSQHDGLFSLSCVISIE